MKTFGHLLGSHLPRSLVHQEVFVHATLGPLLLQFTQIVLQDRRGLVKIRRLANNEPSPLLLLAYFPALVSIAEWCEIRRMVFQPTNVSVTRPLQICQWINSSKTLYYVCLHRHVDCKAHMRT